MTNNEFLRAVSHHASAAADLDGGGAAASLLAEGFLDRARLSGYVADPDDWSTRLAVELLVDGEAIALARADRYDARMPDRGQGSACYGFAFDLRRLEGVSWSELAVGLANTAVVIARFKAEALRDAPVSTAGAVTWCGGLRFKGWLNRPDNAHGWVRGVIEEDEVAVIRTGRHGMIATADRREPRPCFDLTLPKRYADGRVRTIEFVDEHGRALEGSPVSFLAFADGLTAFLDRWAQAPGEAVRGTDYERRFPQSTPFNAYEDWRERFVPAAAIETTLPFALVLVGEDGIDETLSGVAAAADDCVVGALPSSDGGFDPADLLKLLEEDAQRCPIIVIAPAGTRFERGGLESLVQALTAAPDASCAYGDLLIYDEVDSSRRALPIALPDFDYERCLEQGYAAWCFAIRREEALAAARAGAASAPAVLLESLRPSAESMVQPLHLTRFVAVLPSAGPGISADVLRSAVLTHLAERGLRADAEAGRGRSLPTIFLRRAITAETITVVVPTSNRADEVRSCLDHVRGLRTRHRLELVVADMGSSEPDLLRYLISLKLRDAAVVRVPGARNVARALNLGAARARNRFLLFLDPAVILVEPDPIDNLVSRCSDPTAAAAAPTLVWPDGSVQSAGLVLAHAFGAASAASGFGDAELGYGEMMAVAQQRSALPTSCLLVKRQDHERIGGFDERRFGRIFFAADYGLRLGAGGRRLVVTPHVRAISRREPIVDRSGDSLGPLGATRRRELANLRLRWGEALERDPFYNALLALDGELHAALAWPPRLTKAAQASVGDVKPDSKYIDEPTVPAKEVMQA